MALPLVYGIQPAIGAVTRIVSTSTVVTRFWNGKEQRAAGRQPLIGLVVPFNGIVKSDKNALRLAIAASPGRSAANLSFAFRGTTYTNLTLMKDQWIAAEQTVGQYVAQLTLRQTIPQSLTAASSLSAYPTLSAGVSLMLPWNQGDNYQTDVNDSPSGMRYAYPWFGGGLASFPTRGLRQWQLSYPMLQDSDLALIEQFFIGVNGQTQSFSFTDPDDGTTYANCRFGQDDLTITHQRYNLSSISSLVIQEFNV
jgi:hypothetical protein